MHSKSLTETGVVCVPVKTVNFLSLEWGRRGASGVYTLKFCEPVMTRSWKLSIEISTPCVSIRDLEKAISNLLKQFSDIPPEARKATRSLERAIARKASANCQTKKSRQTIISAARKLSRGGKKHGHGQFANGHY